MSEEHEGQSSDYTEADLNVASYLNRPDLHQYGPDQPPAASEFGLGLPGATPRVPPSFVQRGTRTYPDLDDPGGVVMLPHTSQFAHSDRRGIYLYPDEWNTQRLPYREEELLAYFFKLIYLERARQLKKWGDQRRPDGVGPKHAGLAALYKQTVERKAAAGTVTWFDILLEEVYEAGECDAVVGPEQVLRKERESAGGTPEEGGEEGDLEGEVVQSAAVLAAWYSDLCRRAQEIMVGVESGGKAGMDHEQLDDISIEGAEAVAEELEEREGRTDRVGSDPGCATCHGQGELDRDRVVGEGDEGKTLDEGMEGM